MEEVIQRPNAKHFVELNSKLDEISASLQSHQLNKTKPRLNAAALALLQKQQDFILTLASLPVTNESREKIKTLEKQMIDISTVSIHQTRNQGEVTLARQMREMLILLKRVTDDIFETDVKTSTCPNTGTEDGLWRRLVENPHDRIGRVALSNTRERMTSSRSRELDEARSIMSRQVTDDRDLTNDDLKIARRRNRLTKMRMCAPSRIPTPSRSKIIPIIEVDSESTDVEPNQCCTCRCKYGSDELSLEQNSGQTTTQKTESSLASESSQGADNREESELCPDVELTPQGKQDLNLHDIDSGMVPDMSGPVYSSISQQEMTQPQEESSLSGYISPAPTEESNLSNVFDGVDIHLSPSDSSLHSFASFYSEYTQQEDESFRGRPRSDAKTTDNREGCCNVTTAESTSHGNVFTSLTETDGVPQCKSKVTSRCDALKSMTMVCLVALVALVLCLYLKATGATAVLDYYSWWEVLYKHTDVTKMGDSQF